MAITLPSGLTAARSPVIDKIDHVAIGRSAAAKTQKRSLAAHQACPRTSRPFMSPNGPVYGRRYTIKLSDGYSRTERY
ncbi:MAG: hypothetical protein EOP20_01015 [Hyphomicrobiales bacterium]|nr:MAG: hypothetical protein EOP20_01015 [Hyphomicrobiales bacterium]